jgi:hypothetical protein
MKAFFFLLSLKSNFAWQDGQQSSVAEFCGKGGSGSQYPEAMG